MLEVRGLHCRYGKVGVLKGISLEVRAGARAGLNMLEVRGLHCRHGKISMLTGNSLGARRRSCACLEAEARHA